MKVLVVGGTGFIGTALCEELHERDHEVTVLSRDPGGADLPDGVRTVAGDVTAYDSIEGAFEDQDVVVYLVALSPLFKPKGGEQRHFDVHLGGVENVLRAAEEHGVGKIVHMSGLGADPDAPTAFLEAKGKAERAVEESGLDYVIFRPSIVFGEGDELVGFTRMVTPPVVAPMPGGGKTRFQVIWVGDLVPMLADAVEDDAHDGNVYEIGGPEVLTLAEIAKLVRGGVAIVPVPLGLAKIGVSIAGVIPGFPFGRDQMESLKVDNSVADNDATAFGVDPAEMKTLREYLQGA